MKIVQLAIENLFAYSGRQELDLSGTSETLPIVVIMGRNGYGKTSLLKSLWLLFLGPEHRLLRTVGYRAHPIGWRQVLWGTDDERYQGAFNTRARENPNSRYGITALITEDDGTKATIERYWTSDVDGPTGALRVQIGDQLLIDDDADAFLLRRFPRAVIPYFFFDGEQIQEIAEGRDSERTEHIEYLLGLRHAIHFQEQLDTISNDLGRAHLQNNVRNELEISESELKVVAAEIRRVNSSIEEINVDIGRLRDKEETLIRRIENITRGAANAGVSQTNARIEEIRNSFESRRSEFFESFLSILPIVSNELTLNLAVDNARESYESHRQSIDRIVQEMIQDAPVWVFEKGKMPTPPLTQRQRELLQSKLVNYLQSVIGELDDSNLPRWQLGSDRSYELFDQLIGMAHSIRRDRQLVSTILSDLSSSIRAIREEEDALLNMSALRESEREEVQQLESDRRAKSSEIQEKSRELGALQNGLQDLERRRERLESNRRRLDKQLNDSIQNDVKARLAIELSNMVNAYRIEKRRRHRAEIEERLNARFIQLFSGHRHISKLSVDDDFVIRAYGTEERSISLLGVSHGMRQLMATALLWSLTEQSRYHMPVFIDTPLARLDRENQESLLVKYYPGTSEQVVLLATDSELDDRKLSLIADRVGKIIDIENKDGDAASFSPRILNGGTT